MAAKPLTNEAIALTEKKMDMTLEDIIKMSKKPTTSKPNKKERVPNKNQKPLNNATPAKANPSRARQFLNSRSSLRQGVLAQRRSTFQGNQFPLATEFARKAAVAPLRNRPINRNRMNNWNKPRYGAPPIQRRTEVGFAVKPRQQVKVVPNRRPQTLDSLFANMKEQRMRIQTQQNVHNTRRAPGAQQRQWGRGRFSNYVN